MFNARNARTKRSKTKLNAVVYKIFSRFKKSKGGACVGCCSLNLLIYLHFRDSHICGIPNMATNK